MKRLITRWDCDRCGYEVDLRGEKWLPPSWRVNDFDLPHEKRSAVLCPTCVESLVDWLTVFGDGEAADV